MNKLFMYLLVIGLVILVIVAAWEIYQVSSGAKSTGSLTVVEISNPVLIPEALEDHLKEDPDYSTFLTGGTTNNQ